MKESQSQQIEEYNNAPDIPVTISNYIKILIMVYREKIFKSKYFLILLLFSIPLFVVAIYFLPNDHAFYLAGGIFMIIALFFPLLFTCLVFLLQKMKVFGAYKKYGFFKEI